MRMPRIRMGRAGRRRLGSVAIDLAVVFVGVYSAFWLNAWREERAAHAEQQRVSQLLAVGIERLGNVFANMQRYHGEFNPPFLAQLREGEVPDFHGTFYAAPQYPIDVITYVLNRESYGNLPLDLYVPLTEFSNGVQRLMYVEEKLVQCSEQHSELPAADTPGYGEQRAEQLRVAQRYYQYLEMRRRIAGDLERRAAEFKAVLR